MGAFYLAGPGMTGISSESTVEGLIFVIAVDVLYLVVVPVIGKKRGWLSSIRKDDREKWNVRAEAKREAKASICAAKHAAKQHTE